MSKESDLISIRCISENGKISIRKVKLDEDDLESVDCVSGEPLILQARTYTELVQLLELCLQNSTKPVIVLNAGNKELYKWS